MAWAACGKASTAATVAVLIVRRSSRPCPRWCCRSPAGMLRQGSENQVYQRLRGHLAALRLSAAEALPAELDHARARQLSHTAFLERLLALEVDAAYARL
jgi:hypothetical protein